MTTLTHYNFNAPVYAQQNNQMQPNVFGKEDVSYITDEQKTMFMLKMCPLALQLLQRLVPVRKVTEAFVRHILVHKSGSVFVAEL